jgi:scyllo-inosamine-4-phosphate amidinotransferase 1
MKISSHNDWDPLREIIVGTACGARVPTVDASTMSFSYAGASPLEVKALEGPLPQWLIEEANEDIEGLVNVLKAAGVKVHRPATTDTGAVFSTPEWSSTSWYNWCPRDLLLPLRNLMIEVPSPTRSRYFETRAYRHIMLEAIADGVEWIAAPKPVLPDESYTFEDLSKPTLRNLEPAFDAPNIVRLGRDLLYQVSNSGNLLGSHWLRNLLSPRGYRVHLTPEIYSFAHFDSTILPLRPGLVLLNATRVNPSNCPNVFAKWDKLYFKDVIDSREARTPHGKFTPCSPYIALNVLSIDPRTVCVEATQLPLIRLLERHGFTCVPLRMRHARNLSGGFHCATLDLVREGELEDYCS